MRVFMIRPTFDPADVTFLAGESVEEVRESLLDAIADDCTSAELDELRRSVIVTPMPASLLAVAARSLGREFVAVAREAAATAGVADQFDAALAA